MGQINPKQHYLNLINQTIKEQRRGKTGRTKIALQYIKPEQVKELLTSLKTQNNG